MVASVSSPADLINLGLVRIGFPGRIGNLYDGSDAARKALDCYAQTRDELLVDGQWQFAERNIVLTLLKSAPAGGYFPPTLWNPATNPPPQWLFEYAYPADCLKMRAINPQPLFIIDFTPEHNEYSIDNDNAFTPPQRVILTNVPSAMAEYVGQVTDLATMDVEFVEAFATAVGRRLAPLLVGLEAAKLAAQDEGQSLATAKDIEGGNR